MKRYSQLAPFAIDQQIDLCIAAINFFSVTEYAQSCEAIGKQAEPRRIGSLSGQNFATYLEKTKKIDDPYKYMYPLQDLLAKLERAGLLSRTAASGMPLGGTYMFALELTTREREGVLWLAKALGGEFLYHTYGRATVQITGITKDGDIAAGSAVLFQQGWLLTCAHVIDDMTLDERQTIGGQFVNVVRTFSHAKIDVGLIQLSASPPLVPGLSFRDPRASETVYTLGYPRVPLSSHPALLIQRGEVTAPTVSLFGERNVFLYSAIARPGNSGGPILSETGSIVGIVSEELSSPESLPQAPFHAGVSTSAICQALVEMSAPISLPVEDYT